VLLLLLFEVARAARERTSSEVKGVILIQRSCYTERKK